eukprot:COSAG06_NODE_1397_length_9587_cov_6.056598_8_plen_181_part_00
MHQASLQHAGCSPAAIGTFCANAKNELRCGVASSVFTGCPMCLQTAEATGALGFWWNWGQDVELDTAKLSTAEVDAATQRFVPMQWGQGLPPTYDFLSSGATHVMGFNEPDMYGPSCDGDWEPPGYGCAPGVWSAATSSGWAPLFDPSTGVWEDGGAKNATFCAIYTLNGLFTKTGSGQT